MTTHLNGADYAELRRIAETLKGYPLIVSDPNSLTALRSIMSSASAGLLSMLEALEAAERERDEARAALAYVLDHAVYSDSYGVHGSDFTCCHFCQGGGAPGVALEHDADCPVGRYPRAVADWFEEMEAERADREAAESKVSDLERELSKFMDLYDAARGDVVTLEVRQEAAERQLGEVRGAVFGIADDYMTSENHHPGYVLIPVEKFERLRSFGEAPALLSSLPCGGDEGSSVAESGSTASPKSDGLCKSEGED
jgi:hypothetical protein